MCYTNPMPLPVDMEARAFKIEPVRVGPHKFDFVSLEGDFFEHYGDTDITPPDRLERVAEVVGRNSLTVVPYFPPELDGDGKLSRGVYQTPVLGAPAKLLFGPSEHYGAIAEICRKRRKPVGVADVTNRPAFGLYSTHLSPLAYLDHALGAF